MELTESNISSRRGAGVADQTGGMTWVQRSARKRVLRWMDELQGGVVQFEDPIGSMRFGTPESPLDVTPQVNWSVKSGAFYSQLATSGSLGLAESYLQGDWETNDLAGLLTILCRNLDRSSQASSFLAALSNHFGRFVDNFDGNSLNGSRRHIAAHYDLSNEFFELFLDSTLMYSSGFFERDGSTLHDASIAKLQKICDKLELRKSDHVLEIGTGWGGFALYAAEKYGVNLTTTTISAAQIAKARERIDAASIGDRVELLDVDYRELDGQYDKLVSIEMVEAVGEKFLDTYFRKCGQLLKPGGRFVIQAIVMPEQRFASYRRGIDFIQKYIFPGGFLPSVARMQESVGRTSNLRLHGVEDLSPHYARTLHEWRKRFLGRLDDVRQQGFDERFIRMWEYYLCYCEAAFREQAVRVVQVVWDKPLH